MVREKKIEMNDIYTLSMDRSKLLRMIQACSHICLEFEDEARDENASPDGKKIAESGAKMWRRIHDEAKRQIDEQDRANGIK